MAKEDPGQVPKILDQPLPVILAEMDANIKREADAAVSRAMARTEEVARQAKEAADLAAESARRAEAAYAKASEALPMEVLRRLLGSRQLLFILLLCFLGTVFAATAISLGLSLLR